MKLTLMLVEDEPIEREALRIIILNNCDDAGEIYCAQNGFEAIRLCKEHEIDLAFVDINMPGINGLEAIREMKKLREGMAFVILSSYNRFEYAQEALKLGVEDFMLKSARLEEIKDVIARVRQKIETEQKANDINTGLLGRLEAIKPIVESDLVYCIISNGAEAELKKLFAFYPTEFVSGFCIALECKDRQQGFLRQLKQSVESLGAHCAGGMFNDIFALCVYSDKHFDRAQNAQIARFLSMLLEKEGVSGSIGAGSVASSLGMLNESYRQAAAALQNALQSGNAVELNFDSPAQQNAVDAAELAQKCAMAMLTAEHDEFFRCSSEAAMTILSRVEDHDRCKEAASKVLILCEKTLIGALSGTSFLERDAIARINASTDGMSLRNTFMVLMDLMWQSVSASKNSRSNVIIQNALGYIDANYCKQISLEETAQELNITTFYLSKLLNRHAKMGFSDLVSQRRIEKAKELLKDNKSVKEVTFEVGFNSQNYFAKVFKKHVGVTPSEYKDGGTAGDDNE